MYWERKNTAPSRIVDDATPAVLPSLHLFNFFQKNNGLFPNYLFYKYFHFLRLKFLCQQEKKELLYVMKCSDKISFINLKEIFDIILQKLLFLSYLSNCYDVPEPSLNFSLSKLRRSCRCCARRTPVVLTVFFFHQKIKPSSNICCGEESFEFYKKKNLIRWYTKSHFVCYSYTANYVQNCLTKAISLMQFLTGRVNTNSCQLSE